MVNMTSETKKEKDNCDAPLVSIVVVNYNGRKFLNECLTSILESNYGNKEVILVDNASSDGSVQWVQKHFPEIRVLSLQTNLGFAGGANTGAEMARGKYISILNEDMKVHKDFLNEIIPCMEKNPRVHICGSTVLAPGELYNGRYGLRPFRVFAVGGGAMTATRTIMDVIGLFDDAYFLYDEDVDFCWRAWLSGYETFQVPRSILYHYKRIIPFQLRISNQYLYFTNRNRTQSMIKNLDLVNTFMLVPLFVMIRLMFAIVAIAIKRMDLSLALVKAISWNIIRFPKTWKCRLSVQSSRKVSDNVIKLINNIEMGSVFSPLDFTDLLQKFQGLRKR